VGNLGLDTLEGGDGNDALVGGNLDVNAPDVSTDHLDGGAGGDILRGDSGPADRTNVATVGGGNDVLVGGGGNDLLLAGPGRDWADGGGGNDFFRGGDGDDFFSGGDGDDVGLGEGGDDALQGQAGRDVLIGGRNLDHLDGGADDDLLIGGVTSHDANDAAILSVAAEWNSARSYAARTANLRGVINPEFANRLNGNVYLTPNVTVLIDGAIDILAGGADVDWFFRLGEEIVADAAPGERIL
jgi:Ca2+-binding RTX toxin-like protein